MTQKVINVRAEPYPHYEELVKLGEQFPDTAEVGYKEIDGQPLNYYVRVPNVVEISTPNWRAFIFEVDVFLQEGPVGVPIGKKE